MQKAIKLILNVSQFQKPQSTLWLLYLQLFSWIPVQEYLCTENKHIRKPQGSKKSGLWLPFWFHHSFISLHPAAEPLLDHNFAKESKERCYYFIYKAVATKITPRLNFCTSLPAKGGEKARNPLGKVSVLVF